MALMDEYKKFQKLNVIGILFFIFTLILLIAYFFKNGYIFLSGDNNPFQNTQLNWYISNQILMYIYELIPKYSYNKGLYILIDFIPPIILMVITIYISIRYQALKKRVKKAGDGIQEENDINDLKIHR